MANEGLGWDSLLKNGSCHPGGDDCILGGGLDPNYTLSPIIMVSWKMGAWKMTCSSPFRVKLRFSPLKNHG